MTTLPRHGKQSIPRVGARLAGTIKEAFGEPIESMKVNQGK
jgi:hypothetical protein